MIKSKLIAIALALIMVASLVVVMGADVQPRYWWEGLPPQERDAIYDFLKQHFPYRDILNMTPGEFNQLRRLPPQFVPEDVMRERPGVIAVYGKLPSFETNEEKYGWLDVALMRLAGLTELDPFFYPDGPITAHGISYRGYFFVGIHPNAAVDDAIIREIYAVISGKAERVGIQDVPVVFERMGPLVLDVLVLLNVNCSAPQEISELLNRGYTVDHLVCICWRDNCTLRGAGNGQEIVLEAATQPNYGARYRPIPGGVMMAVQHPHATYRATLSFAARDPWWWWIRDYVISGHLGPGGTRIAVGTQIWQPTVASGNEAGRVERVAGLNGFADAARVDFGHVTPHIHRGGGQMMPVSSWRDPVVSDWIMLSGISSGISMGRVTETGVSVHSPAFGTLRGQVLATYLSAPGDSGGPIHMFDTGRWPTSAIIVGAHVGRVGGVMGGSPVFSPVSGIRTELGVVPLTT